MSRAQEIADLLSGVTITTADNTAQLTLTSTDADANHGPRLDLKRDSGSPADNDTVGRLRFLFDNDAAEETEAVRIDTFIPDVSDGTEDATFQILTMVGGTIRSRVEHNSTETVFNQDSQDLESAGMNGLVENIEPDPYQKDTLGIEEDVKSVKYSILYMKAVKALQEAMTRIETLEAKVTALENA